MAMGKIFTREKNPLFLIIGLGNPGREYENTRHNIGFLVIDQLADRWGVNLKKIKFRSVMGEHKFQNASVILVKPQTYMNHSGEAVGSFFRYYKPPLKQVLVVFDDLDLPFGSLRFRQSGGSSGQKGMQSIINKLGQDDFPRLRVGVGRPPGRMDASDYILKPFKNTEKQALDLILQTSAQAIEAFLMEGLEKCMTIYNGSVLMDE